MLYHYTSLASLALIMANKTIKFNRLDLVDDPDESLFGFGENNMQINSFSFASCWTKDSMENIALWKMYADLKGVRIGLDEDMFITYGNSFLEEKYYRDGNLFISHEISDTAPHPVEYNLKDDAHAIEFYRRCVVRKGLDILLSFKDVALHKKEYWDFQKEIRFIIRGMSANEKGVITDDPIERTEFYIPLKLDILKKMEIVLGPKAGIGESAIVDALIYHTFQNDHKIEIRNSVVKLR